ncbi:protein DCL, chloroplastic [Punica granatum]|uniref:Uncharacterized protein n=2 Tax=Punica granatum TaxID=22663 RepID=A0A218X7N6_PUNGR|nr:protein DCL, chloroplastic [Punica granatum]OWM80686.1 hypothetical protein CDL15_Pgr006716 [Punica granatum]PKI48066.1 hypothetical protein CRG98_031583 [Punica granatum]
MAAAPLLLRGAPLLRLRLHHRLAAQALPPPRRPCCAAAFATASFSTEPAKPEGQVPSADSTATVLLTAKEPPRFHRWDDPDYRKWKDKEEEILRDIRPILSLAKDILHSKRYLDGERLAAEDETVIVEKLLSYHPRCDDKIGCGLDGIMVDRHPQFRRSRCLFVVRTDGGWIDFSYQKCLRAYVRAKYPSYAERFIKEHFKRGSG